MNEIIVSNKKRIALNIKTTSKDGTVWFLIAFISSLVFTHSYFTIDWNNTHQSSIALTEIIALPINSLFIGILYSNKSFKTYLYFTAFFEFIATILFLASRDAGQLDATVTGSSATLKVEGTIKIIALMFLTGFMISTTFIIPFILLTATFSILQSLTILRVRSPYLRMIFWMLAQMLILFIIGSILTNLSVIQDQLLGNMWSDYLVKDLHVSTDSIKLYGNMIYDVISKFLFVCWFPLFIRLNNIRKTNIFLSFSSLLVIPSIVTFMMINIDFISVHGPLLSLPIFFLSISVMSLTRYFVYFIKTTILNTKECTKDDFIPYVIQSDKQKDIMALWLLQRRTNKSKKKK